MESMRHTAWYNLLDQKNEYILECGLDAVEKKLELHKQN